ncbi:MAG: hypothetical protein ACLTJN_04305 [Monoglobus pectinilyticus]
MRCSYSDKVGRKQAEQQKAWSKVYTGGSCIDADYAVLHRLRKYTTDRMC